MDEHLVEYSLGLLDPVTTARVEGHLETHPEARARLALLEQALAPLAADADDIDPPPGLTLGTLARIAEHRCMLPAAPPTPAARPARRRAAGCAGPTASSPRCCSSSSAGWRSRPSPASGRRTSAPPAPTSCARSTPASWPTATTTTTPSRSWTAPPPPASSCPCCPTPGCWATSASPAPPRRSPTRLAARSPRWRRCTARTPRSTARPPSTSPAATPTRSATSTRRAGTPACAATPATTCRCWPTLGDGGANSPNHGGAGQNVLHIGGHVTWCTNPGAGIDGDNIYLNQESASGRGCTARTAFSARATAAVRDGLRRSRRVRRAVTRPLPPADPPSPAVGVVPQPLVCALPRSAQRTAAARYFGAVQVHLGTQVEADVAEFDQISEGMSRRTARSLSSRGHLRRRPIRSRRCSPMTSRFGFRHPRRRRSSSRVIELVSPRNKDRAEAREAFAAKCAAYLQLGVGLLVIDIVTNRHANLHNTLASLLHWPAAVALPAETTLYAASYHPVRRGAKPHRQLARPADRRPAVAGRAAAGPGRRVPAARSRSRLLARPAE